MYRTIGFVFLITLACFSTTIARWDRFIIGPGGSQMTTLTPGQGRNDGIQRIYAACFDGHIYEFSDSSGQWYRRDLGLAGALMTYVNLGKGRSDSLLRVYGSSNDYSIWEYSYSNPGDYWFRERVGGGGLYMNSVCVGNGRGDTIQHVYGGCFDGIVYEFTRQGNGWIQTSFSGAPRICDVAAGFGRGDSVMRVYSAGYYGDLVESTYDSLGWTSRTIWSGSGLQSVAVGKGRLMDTLSDQRDHVYIGAMNGAVYELVYGSGGWITYTLGTGGGGMYSVAVGPGRGDFKNRVYSGGSDGKIYEFSHQGGGWIADTVGSANGHIDGVAVGRLEVDGVYATSYDGRVYGFRYSPSGVESKEPPASSGQNLRLTALPNPFRTGLTITLSLDREEAVGLDIYGLDGRLVRSLRSGKAASGVHRVAWDGSGQAGSRVGPGVYFVRLRTPFRSATIRILKLD